MNNNHYPTKKILVLDLDNTLWGGVVADDGLEGLVIGGDSTRGAAFAAFQSHLLLLKNQGVLLAVCSKNEESRAKEVFERHPGMVLQLHDFVDFRANWEPKSENIRAIAARLNLGLESFVFVDDSPAEIEIVRQFTPEVATILLGSDPSGSIAQLQDSGFFQPHKLTAEDAARTDFYRQEEARRRESQWITDYEAFLKSLEMVGKFKAFQDADIPRLEQLINRSNQFNLTTRRRSEAEIAALIADPSLFGFSMRLKDRFGDHGLILIVIGRQMGARGEVIEIDTWLMSCRVLKRHVEEEALNELMRIAAKRGAARVEGVYIDSGRNGMVRDFYTTMGFDLISETETERRFELSVADFKPVLTDVRIAGHAFEAQSFLG